VHYQQYNTPQQFICNNNLIANQLLIYHGNIIDIRCPENRGAYLHACVSLSKWCTKNELNNISQLTIYY